MSLHGCATGLLIVFCAGWAFAQADSDSEKLRAEAQTAFEHGEFDKCLEITNRVIAANPKDHAAYYLRASSHVELGAIRHDVKEVRLGIEDARKALGIGGVSEVNYYLPYFLGMTTLANIDNRKEHAEVVLQEAQKVLARPTLKEEQRANILFQRAGAYVFLGKLYMQPPGQPTESGKNFELAIQDFQAAIKSFPGHLGAYIGLAESYDVAKKPDKALAAFTAAVEKFPTNPLVFNNRGLFLHRQHRPKEAIADYNKALQIDSRFATAYANRGFAQQAERNLPAAEADYSEAIRNEPNNPLFHSLRGTCRLSQLNTTGAMEDYSQAIRLNPPQNAIPHADLGFAKFFARDFPGALASFDQAVAIDPNMRYLNPWRVWSLVLQQKMDAVGPILDASLKKAEPDWIDELVLYLNGKISEQDMVKFTEKTTEPDYKSAQLCEAYYFIGERRLLAGDKTSALQFFEQITKMNSPSVPDLSAYRGALFELRAAGAR